jgi:hypothetical protein
VPRGPATAEARGALAWSARSGIRTFAPRRGPGLKGIQRPRSVQPAFHTTVGLARAKSASLESPRTRPTLRLEPGMQMEPRLPMEPVLRLEGF